MNLNHCISPSEFSLRSRRIKWRGWGGGRELGVKNGGVGGGVRGKILFLLPHPLPFIRLLRRLSEFKFDNVQRMRS